MITALWTATARLLSSLYTKRPTRLSMFPSKMMPTISPVAIDDRRPRIAADDVVGRDEVHRRRRDRAPLADRHTGAAARMEACCRRRAPARTSPNSVVLGGAIVPFIG